MFFLLPHLFYLVEEENPPILRETEVYAQDVAQMMLYGHIPSELPHSDFAIWLDERQIHSCPYRFRYCTERFYKGGEHKICAAECLQ